MTETPDQPECVPKVWLITGAASGIGIATVRAAAAAGDIVVATGRNLERLNSAVSGIPGSVRTTRLDVTEVGSIQDAVSETANEFGRIDIVVNNAGVGLFGVFESYDEAQTRSHLNVNFFGMVNVTRVALPVFRSQRSGHLINFSSVSGIRGVPGSTMYAASKFAVEGFTEALSGELAQFGIAVTLIEPGLFRTDFMDERSVQFGNLDVADYRVYEAALRQGYVDVGRGKGRDPARLAAVMVQFTRMNNPPRRFQAGSDAVLTVERKVERLLSDLQVWREMSESMDGHD